MFTLYHCTDTLACFSHIVFLHLVYHLARNIFVIPDDAVDRQNLGSLNSILHVVLNLLRELFILSSTFTVTP